MNDSTPTLEGPVLSVVIPLLNEEAVLDEAYHRVKTVLDREGITYEIVFVDDGSTDQSRAILAALAYKDPAVRLICLSRNFGHELATTAGLQYARGQAAVVMDADLQDPPETIPEFLQKWREGYQVVYGVRERRKGETWLKKLTSFLFYRLMGGISDVPIPRDTGDFRLMDRRVLDVYRQFHEDPRFFRGLIAWIGFKQIGVPFVRQRRKAGFTKYRYGRLLKLAFDTITAFSTFPAFFITVLAAVLAGATGLGIAVVLVLWALGMLQLEPWMWAGLGFLILWNIQYLSLAFLGEYIVRTHRHTQQRPLFIVDKIIEHPSQAKQVGVEAITNG
jgi:dolichol-phosphate mannosyltransferase